MSIAALRGRDWALITSTVLALNAPMSLGLAASTPKGTVAATFAAVQAQETDLSQGNVIVEKTLDNNRIISHTLYESDSDRFWNDGSAAVVFGKDALTSAADITFTVSGEPARD